MKALSVQALPVGKWLYEVKLDGYRALAFKSGKATRLVSRNQKAFNYPELLDALKSLRAEHFVIDGEITALDPKGRSSFQLLQAYERAALGCFFMKVITLILIVFSVMARAEGEGVEFYFSKMRWSSNQDPVDAGAIDGAYYADLMASHGVRKVGFDFVDAKEMRNPRWNSKTPDDMEAAEYALSFTFGFNYEAANRGMIAPSGDPYRNEGKTPQELTLETEHWANRHARGEVDQPTPTPTPGPVTSTLVPMPKEMQDKIKAEEIAKRNKDVSYLRNRKPNARLMEISLKLQGLLRHNEKLPRYDGPKRTLRRALKAQNQLRNKASKLFRSPSSSNKRISGST